MIKFELDFFLPKSIDSPVKFLMEFVHSTFFPDEFDHCYSIPSVAISKQHKDVAIIISSARYKALKNLEDILYGKAAELAIKEGFSSDKQAQGLLDSI